MTFNRISLAAVAVFVVLMSAGPLSVMSGYVSAEADGPEDSGIIPDYSWYDGGSSPYQVSSVEGLKGFANLVNGQDGKGAVDFYGKTVELTDDLYMNGPRFSVDDNGRAVRGSDGLVVLSGSGSIWEPIGSSFSNPFRGTFEGNSHLIYDLVVSGYQVAGLFGYVTAGSIRNVSIVGESAMFADYLGRSNNDGSRADVIPSGGIVGAVESIRSAQQGISISGCYNGARVESAVSAVSGKAFDPLAGGIAGYVFQENDGRDIVINDCYNSGTICALDVKTYDSCDSGGIVGQVYTRGADFYGDVQISNCGNEGGVSSIGIGSGVGDPYVSKSSGGIVGNLKCTTQYSLVGIVNCYNAGDIRSAASSERSYADAGGIIGSIGTHDSSSYSYYKSIGTLDVENCYNGGNLSAESVIGVNNVGGIIGFITDGEVNTDGKGTWANCYWKSGTAEEAIGDDERKFATYFTSSELYTDDGMFLSGVDVDGTIRYDLLSALNSYSGDVRKWELSFDSRYGRMSFDHPLLMCDIVFRSDGASIDAESPLGHRITVPQTAYRSSQNWSLNGFVISMDDFILMGDITLDRTEAEICTVTFNPMGGTVHPESMPAVFGQEYGPLPDAYRNGYSFIGWFTGISGGTQVTPDTRVPTTADHVLYARWSADVLTVTPQDMLSYTGGPSNTGDPFPQVYYQFRDNRGHTISDDAASSLPWKVDGKLFSAMTPEEKEKLDPDGDGLPFIGAFFYVDDGKVNSQASDDDRLPGTYVIKVANRNQITLDGYSLSFADGILTVRGADPISDSIAKIESTRNGTGLFNADTPVALLPDGSSFQNVGGKPIIRDNVYLLVDSLFSEYEYKYMLDTVGDIPQTEGMHYMYSYMALVNHFNGNEVVFADSKITVFVPYSSFSGSVNDKSEIAVVHFAGYNREAGTDIRDSVTEVMYGDEIVMAENGVYFTVDSMSPIMIAFTESSEHSDCLWIVLAVVIVAVILFILFLIWYRRRQEEEEE